MISATHTVVYAEDAESARAFFQDVLRFPSVDAGDGWLIFALPPAELGVHPGPGWGRGPGQHELFLMCRDVHATVEELRARGVDFVAPVEDEGFGLVTRFRVPGLGDLGLYEPRHRSPLPGVSSR